MNIKALLANAGDIPEGIKALLRQRNQPDMGREDINYFISEVTFTPDDPGEDGFTFTFDPEDDDGEA